MRLDEARARKSEILTQEGSRFTAAAADPGTGGVFVGIVPSDDPEGYRIAIRVTGDDDVEPTERMDALRATAGPDAEIRYVGRVRALSADAPQPLVDRGSAGSEPPGPVRTEIDPDEPPAEPPTEPDEPPADPDDPPTEPDEPDEPDEPSQPPGQEPTSGELQQRIRPLVRGSSVAHVDVTAGTLGGFVTLAGSDQVHVLSNNHVLADSDRGTVGDEVRQPAPYDGGESNDRIGTLAKAVQLDGDQPNLVDAAVAVLDPEVEVDAAAHDGAVRIVVDPAEVTGRVRKVGRTTGVTRGRISAFEVDGVPVGYDTGTFTFDNQVEVEGVSGAFSAGGDSGSLITTEEDEPRGVGLLFAGSSVGGPSGTGVTYANPLQAVLDELDASLLTEG